jgi:adenosine deaminase
MPELTPEIIRRAPKALLHDHLDGGLRPATIVELAAEYGYAGLPTTNVDDLTAHIRQGAARLSCISKRSITPAGLCNTAMP